jgi:hypothetical protein
MSTVTNFFYKLLETPVVSVPLNAAANAASRVRSAFSSATQPQAVAQAPASLENRNVAAVVPSDEKESTPVHISDMEDSIEELPNPMLATFSGTVYGEDDLESSMVIVRTQASTGNKLPSLNDSENQS